MDSFLSSLRCDARNQPWPTGVCGSIAPWNTTSLRSPVNTRSTTNRSASLVEDETKSLTAEGPVISVSCVSGSLKKVTPSPKASKRATALPRAGLCASAELRPLGALERPFVLSALHELVDVTHLQLHARLPVEAVVLAMQEVIEEAQLQLATVIRVEMGPVLDAVHLEPFVLGGRAHEAFEVAARMQGLAAPIGGRKQRRLDL